MDTSKQPQTSASQDSSDDLIDELARLVAQDAQSQTSGPQAARVEPRFAPASAAPEPRLDEERTQPAPARSEHSATSERHEPRFAQGDNERQDADQVPEFEFDFGFGSASGATEPEQQPQPDRPAPQQPAASEPSASDDPIADLIATAEAEHFQRDEGAGAPEAADNREARQDNDWFAGASASNRDAAADRDPLTDIEALIGEAARVSDAAGAGGSLGGGRRVRSIYLDDGNPAENQDAPAAGHQPAVPPEPLRHGDDRPLTPSEAAIIAARSDGQANIGRPEAESQDFPEADTDGFVAGAHAAGDSPAGDLPLDHAVEDEFQAEGAPRREFRMGPVLVPAMLGLAILAGLGGIYFTFFAGGGDTGDVPVLAADGEPLKMNVEPQESVTTASQSVVFNELDGGSSEDVAEALVSRDQTGGATGDAVSTIFAPEEGDVGLANRPVRTVTVRPDGTIVSGDDNVAGGSVLPVDRPDVPSVPSSTFTNDPIGEAIAAAMADSGTELPATDAPTETAMAALSSDTADAADTAEAEAAETEAESPATEPAAADVAALDAEDATIGATSPAGDTVGAWVQLSSQRSEEAAQAGIPDLQSRYGSLFDGAELEVNRVDLGDRGIYYRVRLPQPTLAEANAVCGAIQGQGGDCFVLNN